MLTVSSGASHIEPIEPGTYAAVCYGLVDLGEQFSKTYNKWSRKVLLMWEIPSETIDLGEDEPSSRTITKQYTASLNERSILRRDLEAWRGRPFTDAELRSFDLRSIVGAPCMLNIIHREYQNRTFADISGIMKMMKGMTVDTPRLESIVFDLDNPDDLPKLELLPDWIENRVKESRQYKERVSPVPPVSVDEALDALQPEDVADEDDVPF